MSKNQRVRESVSDKKNKAEFSKKVGPYVINRMNEFGTDKFRAEFTLEVRNSIDRYKKKSRENLFAFVMPSGSGKTALCDKFGFMDVDRCSSETEHELLNSMRIACINGKMDWDEHNKYWLEIVNGTLDMIDLSEPTVIMVQTEMIALSIGALPLIGLFPSQSLFDTIYDKKLRVEGNPNAAKLAALNRSEFLEHSNIVMGTKRSYSSFEMLESLVIRTMLVNELPVACPYKYTRSIKSPYYTDSCPEWVLIGDKSKRNVDELLSLFKNKYIPKECMDYFMIDKEIPASYGFGIRMNEWVGLMAQIRSLISDRKEFKIDEDMGKVFPYTTTKMLTRMNINMQRLVKGCDIMGNKDIYDLCSRHVGKPNNFVTAIVCYWLGLGVNMKSKAILFKMLGVSYFWWTDVFKKFHSYIRLSKFFMNTEIDERERQSLMYINLLVGKEDAEADWRQEIEDRTCDDQTADHRAYNKDLKLWTRKQYWSDFKEAMSSAYMRMGDKKILDVSNFDEFYKERYNWLTKGSIVYNDLESSMKKYTIDLIDEVSEVVDKVVGRHNKKSLFEVYDAVASMNVPFELMNVTKMVTKVDECGHSRRALFPGSLIHYIMFCYVLHFAEKQGQVGNVRMNAPPDDDIGYFENKMTGGIPRLLFDWVNYNSFHSQDEMAFVVERLGDVVQGPGDYKYFCSAIAELMYNMVFEDPEGNFHKLGKGLYSGWRGTTFINTVLNFVYVKTAEMSYIRLYDEEPFRYVDGGGDDLDAGMNSSDQGYKMLAVMRCMNFKGKEIKQMIDNKSEFFRITISAEGAFASATRSLATFVNGKWEGSGNIPVKDRISAILDQIAKIVRRGFDKQFANSMAVLCLSHWCKISSGEDWLSLPTYVLHGREEDGGFGIPDRQGKVYVLKEKVPEPKVIKEASNPPGKKASSDYLAKLCRELDEYSVRVVEKQRLEEKMALNSFEIFSIYDYTEMLNFKTEVIGEEDAVSERINVKVYDMFSEFMKIYKGDKEMGKIQRYMELIGNIEFNGKKLGMDQLVEIMGSTINPEVFSFKGDVHYRRLVSEPIAKCITDFCTYSVARQGVDLRIAQSWFKDLCWMCYTMFEVRI